MPAPRGWDWWWDATWNPFGGCLASSPGCTNCYAAQVAGTKTWPYANSAGVHNGVTVVRDKRRIFNGKVTAAPEFHKSWTWPLTCPGAKHPKLGPGAPSLIFVGDMADLFYKRPDKIITRVCATIALSAHIGELLTKPKLSSFQFSIDQSGNCWAKQTRVPTGQVEPMYREGIDLPLDLDLRGLMRSGIIKIVESATSGTGQRAVLGELQLDLGPSDMSTTVSMEIIFDVDANGFLNVSAEDKQSGKTFNKKLVEVIDPFDPGTRLDPEFAIGFSGEDMARARAQADELLTRVHEAEKFLGGNIPPEILSKIVGGRDALQRAMQSRDPIELGGSLAAFCKAVNMKLPARSIAPTFSATPVELSATSALRSIFISYAREDGDWLERIRVHLLQLERLGHVEIWHDGKMMSGVPWQEEIKKALNKATAAVLLVTANFMASKFIYDHELPPILERNRAHGLSIIPVFIGHVYYERDPVLSYLNAFNDPRVPLKAMSEAEVEAQLARLVKELWSCLDRSNLH